MKYRRKTVCKVPFTLMEVVVAMAVFSIMMGILLQFFTNTQKLWSSSENKNTLYADARVAMDLMATALQSNYYSAQTTAFLFGTGNGKTDAMFFPVKMPQDYGSGEELYYVSFIARGGKLYMRTFGSKHGREHYKKMFTNIYSSASAAISDLNLRSDSCLGYKDGESQMVIDGVFSLKCTPIHGKPGESNPVEFATSASDSDALQVPFAVSVEMEMLSRDIYMQWKALGAKLKDDLSIEDESEAAKNLRLANQYKFSRIIYLGFQ